MLGSERKIAVKFKNPPSKIGVDGLHALCVVIHVMYTCRYVDLFTGDSWWFITVLMIEGVTRGSTQL